MTSTRRPFYFDHGVIEFSTKHDVRYYKVSVWSEYGTKQGIIESKPLGEETPEEIAIRVQRMLGSVNGND